jgi:hypothetical protein
LYCAFPSGAHTSRERTLEHNLASRALAEKAGLDLVWRGPDAGNPDPGAIRLVYADRGVEPDAVARLLHLTTSNPLIVPMAGAER